MPFKFIGTEIPDVKLIEVAAFGDQRGFFCETYKRSEFEHHGIPAVFVQDNFSHSVRRVLRGLHYQLPPRAQGKLVNVLRGEIYDVAVDLRRDSPTYGNWVGISLSSDNHRLLYVPEGFAHGFCVLSDEADVLYKVTSEYAPELDRGIIWDDETLAISWPVSVPILSAKDAQLPRLQEAEIHATLSGGGGE